MIIHIMYPNNRYDYIRARKPDKLIAANRIKACLRDSEGRWVDIASQIRGAQEIYYIGPERRVSHRNPFELPA